MKRARRFLTAVFLLIISIFWTHSSKAEKFVPLLSTEAITIDGNLQEDIWSGPGIQQDFYTFNPVFGEKLEYPTIVWMAYDQEALYFAFKCFEPEPSLIKTSISKRDSISTDDWVGIVVDSMGNLQSTSEFYINPDGIQDDGMTSSINGWAFDPSPDFIWDSAGKIGPEGYQVEVRIPLSSLRFKSGETVPMNLMFLRNITHLGKMAAWPEVKSGQTQFTCMLPVIYKNLEQRMTLEILPSITWQTHKERLSRDRWSDSQSDTEIGVSMKYGFSSSIVGEATFNPDYSQVESDAFQVEVNQRYPIFYSEKRAFFMEGRDALDFSIIKNGMMIDPIYTRNIVDPVWAAKLSGTIGKTRFAALAAEDEAAGRLDGSGEHAFYGVGRAKRSIGKDNSIGILYSGHSFNGEKNNVFGTDFLYRLNEHTRFSLSYLITQTDKETGINRTGSGLNAMLDYGSTPLNAIIAFEKYDQDFTMESAFLNRTNFHRVYGYLAPNLYSEKKWIQKIQPFIHYQTLHDYFHDTDDSKTRLGVYMYFIKNSYIRCELNSEKEYWLGEPFRKKTVLFYGTTQLNKYISFSTYYRQGDQIDYYAVTSSLGKEDLIQVQVVFHPGIKWTFDIQYTGNSFRDNLPDSHKEKYSVDIVNLNGTYQFDEHFFVRCALRYNDFSEKLVTDFLASWTFRPGTAAHLGYGSLYENKIWPEDTNLTLEESLLKTRNILYFKISYLWGKG